MKTIEIDNNTSIPINYTGIAQRPESKFWYKNGKLHREDGPAREWSDGYKEWWLEDQGYDQINLNDYVVLDHDNGKYGIMWYRLLDKDELFEYPDLPGLIIK